MVDPVAAVAIFAVLSREENRQELARLDRMFATNRGLGGHVWPAYAQLEEAQRQWRERDLDGSADGTTEQVAAELAAVSDPMELTTSEAAAWLRCTPKWVTRLIARGDLAARKYGRSWLVDRASLEVYRDARRRA